jgi:uncharacterized protein (DUF1330 family)
MAAYMIVVGQIHDRERFMGGYAPAAAALLERCGGRYLLRAPKALLLEGSWGDGASVVISEWPDMATLRRFWDSPEYAAIKQLRIGVIDVQVLAIEAPKIA